MANPHGAPPPPPPLPTDAQRNLQLSYLINNFNMQLSQLLDLPSNPAQAEAAATTAITRLTAHPSFSCVAASYAKDTPTATTIRILSTLSKRATPSSTEDNQPATPTAQTDKETPPYLRALAEPPRRVHRLPEIPVANATSAAPRQPNIILSRQGLDRLVRTATRIVGFEEHTTVKLTLSSPLRGAQHLRLALREGGLREPIALIPTDSPTFLFAVGQPSTLSKILPHYNRYRDIVASRSRILPTLEVSQPNPLALLCETAAECTELYKHATNETLRLSTIADRFPSAKHFARSICVMLDGLTNRLRTTDSTSPIPKQHQDTAEDRANFLHTMDIQIATSDLPIEHDRPTTFTTALELLRTRNAEAAAAAPTDDAAINANVSSDNQPNATTTMDQ